ncbi:MAG: insulinase family protein [Verrucomicrobiae bacterium]|nr:insulinase family protein [Verrucomicrobiae bacterium]
MSTGRGVPVEPRMTRLDGGLIVLSLALPGRASVAVGLWVGVGGRHEPASRNGISHFIEHLLFKGTERRSAAEISQSVEGAGGYLNAFTDEEHTCFFARAQAARMLDLVEVLLDMFLHSRFAPAEIAREREVIGEEIAMYLDQPAERVHDLLNALQFPDHPLGRPVVGTRASLDTLRRADFLQYLSTHYVTGATVIAAAGAVDHDALVRRVRRHGRHFRPGARPAFDPAPPPATAPRFRAVAMASEQVNLSLGIRTCSRHDPRRHAVRLLSVLLGENMSSRLFQVLRETHGLTYNIASSTSFWDDCGDLVISAGLDPGDLERTLRLIRRELRRIANQAPDRTEFRRARDYILGQHELLLEGTEHQMMTLGEQWLGYGRVASPREFQEAIRTVTPSEVLAAARDFVRPAHCSLALVGPERSGRGLERLFVP